MTETLRILSLCSLYPGISRPNFGVFVERQMMALTALGDVDLTIIAARGLPPFPLTLHPHYRALAAEAERETWNGLDAHRPRFTLWPGTNGRWTVAAMTRAVLPLARRLHAEKPFDAVDAQFFFPDGPVAMRVAQALGLPYSVKARGADIHHWGHDPRTAEDVRAAGRNAAGMLAVSAAMKADMVAIDMPGERIAVHYTGIDRARFRPMDRAAAKAQFGVIGPAIATIGALIPRKQQALTIEALTQLPDVTLLIGGQGPDGEMLEALAKDKGVADRVRFLGSVPHDEVPALLNAADVMVLPSTSEGLANAWVEALACGTPIVISDAGGAAELLADPAAGRIVAREAGAVANAVRALLSSPAAPEQVAQAVAAFSWDRNAAQLREHFWRIAGRV